MSLLRLPVVIALGVALTGCATAERVILLSDEDGGHGVLEVRSGEGVLVLDEPLEAANVKAPGRIEAERVDEASLADSFGPALSAMPAPPQRFVLYFEEGTTRLVPSSEPTMNALLTFMDAQPVADIQVIGHTDRVGTVEDNDLLAGNRAGSVRRLLRDAGYSDRVIRSAGRGEREPIVETDDEVREPLNRRVEVVVR